MIDKFSHGFIKSVYDFNDFTFNELICKLAQKMDEVITQSNESFNYLDWLKDQGLSDEVIKIMLEWKENGTLESLINDVLLQNIQNDINNIRTETNTFKTETNETINTFKTEINSQLDNIAVETRKLKFKINVSPWWYNASKTTIDNDIPLFKKMGVDGFTLCVHVENSGDTLIINEDLDLLLYAIGEIKKVGMSVSAIKMHCKQTVFDSVSNSFDQYKSLVFNVANKFKNLDIPYFTYLNEVPEIYNGSDLKNDTLINELAVYIRKLGFKVGVTFANDSEIFDTIYKYPGRVNNYDCFFKNTYTIIGYKGEKTTYQDSVYAWEQTEKIVNLCKSIFPNKPFIFSECGIQHFWEALRNPALYDYPNWGTNGRGKVAEIFYYGLFESKTLNSGLIDEVWIWYPEQMHYDTFYKFINSYTNNGGVN